MNAGHRSRILRRGLAFDGMILLRIGGPFAGALAAATILANAVDGGTFDAARKRFFLDGGVDCARQPGNLPGSVVNWMIGRGAAERFRDRRWFPVNPTKFGRATEFRSLLVALQQTVRRRH